jgi:hypothetical protein
VAVAERVRLFFSPNCHIRTPPLALALARRARETAFRPKVTRPRRGLTAGDLGPAFCLGLGWGEKDEDGNGERRVADDDDSSSSVSSALSSQAIFGSSDGDCPRIEKMFRARLRGETEGGCTWVSSRAIMREGTLTRGGVEGTEPTTRDFV